MASLTAAARAIDRRVRRARDERGAEIIELAIVTPIFALVVAAIFDFGFLFRNWEVATNAAREGARVGVLPAYSCETASPDIQARIDDYMAGSGITAGYGVATGTSAVTAGDHTFNACVVNVTLAQPLPSLKVLGTIFGGAFGSVSITAGAVMRTETQAAAP
jgi:Flp pilus assembly protein TadG